jgi:hypothetical protein
MLHHRPSTGFKIARITSFLTPEVKAEYQTCQQAA